MPDWLHRMIRPREGWLALFLLFVMLLSVGWSVQSARWLQDADFLIPVALWGMLAGALLALLPLSVALTLPLGALSGGLVVLWAVGGEYFVELGQVGRLLALRDDGLQWFRVVANGGIAAEITPYAIGLGVLMWSIAFMAAYTLYRHHRALDAILLVGAALIVNLSATINDLFGYLVLFSIAALLLWLRAALTLREEGWQARRVNENVEVPISIMRSGLTFIAASVALAWILTTVAVAAPLTDAWRGMDVVWNDARGRLEGIFAGITTGGSRFSGPTFGPNMTVGGAWFSNDDPVMQVHSDRAYYMRTVTYEAYSGHGWVRTNAVPRQVAAEGRVFPGYTPERPADPDVGFDRVTIAVTMQGDSGRNLFVPGYPTIIHTPAVVYETAGQPFLGGIDATSAISPGTGYQVTALVSRVTEAQLIGAGTAYPPEILEAYLATPGLTDAVRDLAAEIAAGANGTTPYQVADALADFLRTDPSFTYETNVPVPDPDRDLVDQFLFGPNARVGFCEYYASAMVLMARSLGIPARLAEGYAPGEAIEDGVYQYRNENAHAWAELYFPGYGWQVFESTKSIDAPIRPRGSGVAPPLNDPVGGVDGGGIDEGTGEVVPGASFAPLPGGGIVDENGNTVAPAGEARGGNILIIVALLGIAGVVAWSRMRGRGRRIRVLSPGDRQWMRLAWAANRAGVAQRPNETFYEYAGWLEGQLPDRRTEIREIADGKVWQAYSGRAMTASMIQRIEAAWQRLRLPLVWLAVRRRLRSLNPRRRG